MPSDRNSSAPNARRPGPFPLSAYLLLGLMILLGVLLLNRVFGASREINYSQFLELVNSGQLARVVFIGSDRLSGETINPENELARKLNLPANGRFTVNLPPANDRSELVKDIQTKNPNVAISREEDQYAWVGPVLIYLLPTIVLVAILVLFFLPRMRDPTGSGGFLNNYVRSPARRYERGKARVTFNDVAGMETVKRELQEIVDFLKTPEKFQRLGAQVPKGVLLVGAPGTGKTLLAKAVAGEANVPFFSINGSEFIQMFVGVGASRVRDLFKTARESAPCLVFIDEIDAVGRMRGAGVGGGSDEREQTLNQILSEMDGFLPGETVIVLAATNRPDVLDAALLRPGRFDRHVTIDRPTWQGRLAILKVHTRDKPLADDIDLEAIARKMIGMTGADLRNLCNEAALLATREEKSRIDRSDFERAADRVLIGPTREEVLTTEDKRRTAYHEAGHALMTWLEPAADRPMKVSIIPRGRSLGVNIMLPEEERYHHGRDFFKAQLLALLGGRAADRLVYGEPYAGAENDIKQATKLARHMVAHWGMSEQMGPMFFRSGEEHVFLGKEIVESRDHSEGMAALVDKEVHRLLLEADERAYELLKANREPLDLLAETLLQREELNRQEIEELLGFGNGTSANNRREPAGVGEQSA